MTRFGITGHQDIPPGALAFITGEIGALLAEDNDPVAVSSLARGADQVFAREVLDAGGQLIAVIPSEDYRDLFEDPDREAFDVLLGKATTTTMLPFEHGDEEAFMEAGREVVRRCEVLVAIWDGAPAAGRGGTGDVVAYAESRGRRIRILWPDGMLR